MVAAMKSAEDRSPEEPEENSNEQPLHGSSRSLALWFAVILGVNVLSMLWLSVRADSPAYVRSVLDFFLYGTVGALTAYFAFRALLMFPYRMQDLFVIVMLLSLELKIAVDEIGRLAMLGLLFYGPDNPEHFSQIFQVGLLTGSVAIGGAALGLRHCYILKIESPLGRALTVASGLLVLPAAAGTAGLLVLAGFSFSMNRQDEALLQLLLWFAAMIVTGINVVLFIKSITLQTEIDAKEKMP
jgi:hypothetical protein